ncbi:hypothetical protein [Peribacillus glennii]|uniref:hypothetical protein n=1 Tax=Peribacillus glennii TaxID=2303991 RepID=UPI0013149E77|nr:hypothetical protein [Peribacillus glennii]
MKREKDDFGVLSLEQKRVLQKMNQYVRDPNFTYTKLTYSKYEQLFNLPEAGTMAYKTCKNHL